MLFDNFDKKIKEAAEQHHPAYDENAWRKMENLLDEHLPREKSRRRFFLLALTVLLIGGGAFFLLSKPQGKNPEVQQNNSAATNNDQTDKTDRNATLIQPGIDVASDQRVTENTLDEQTTKIIDKNDNSLGITSHKLKTSPGSEPILNNDLVLKNPLLSDQNKNVVVAQPEVKTGDGVTALAPSQLKDQIANNEVSSAPVSKEGELANNTPERQSAPTANATKNGRPGKGNGFSFFVSAGPDISKAQNSKAGKVTLSWGLGVAYTLNRFTLKTGVFSANKIYWAGPEDYKLSYTPPANLKFMGVDANCRVLEIPVKVSYDFLVKGRSSWFAGGGLSSYFMKREDYVYEYKTNSGNSYYHPYETKNENKHYFSILNLSAGYSYRLSNAISLSAEPYVEVPMTGVGAGKVHLNSGGILFSVGVRPFRK